MSYSRMRDAQRRSPDDYDQRDAAASPMGFAQRNIGKIILGGIAFVLVLSTILSGLFSVHEREREVVTRNGAFLRIAQPGLNLKLPFIDSTESISIAPRTTNLNKLETFTTGDQPQHVDLDFVVQWQVEPASVERVFRLGRDPEALLRTMITDRAKEAVGRRHANAIPAERGAIRDEVTTAVRGEASRLYGVTVTDLQLVNFDYSAAFRQAVDAAAVAQQNQARAAAEAVSATERARGEANARIEQSRGEASARLAIAEAEARSIRLRGEAEAAALSAQNRALAEAGGQNLVSLRQAERWNGQLPTHFVPGASVPFLNLQTAVR